MPCPTSWKNKDGDVKPAYGEVPCHSLGCLH